MTLTFVLLAALSYAPPSTAAGEASLLLFGPSWTTWAAAVTSATHNVCSEAFAAKEAKAEAGQEIRLDVVSSAAKGRHPEAAAATKERGGEGGFEDDSRIVLVFESAAVACCLCCCFFFLVLVSHRRRKRCRWSGMV